MGFGFPRPTRYVKYLLMINIAVFILCAFDGLGRTPGYYSDPEKIGYYLSLKNLGWQAFLPFWTLITYQFLHGNTLHIVFNMIGLYFFGTSVEQFWGSRRFLAFYLGCGVAGGLVFLLAGSLGGIDYGIPIVGASGAVLGLLGACAVLFPHMRVILIFFPLPIRVVAIILGAVYVLNVVSTRDLSDACHLGGMAAGLIYVLGGPYLQQYRIAKRRERYQQSQQRQAQEQQQVDRILDKVRRHGIQSLNWREKRILQKATERQREQERKR